MTSAPLFPDEPLELYDRLRTFNASEMSEFRFRLTQRCQVRADFVQEGAPIPTQAQEIVERCVDEPGLDALWRIFLQVRSNVSLPFAGLL